jgi:hypothetical protein
VSVEREIRILRKLVHNGKAVQTFDVEFTDLQRQVLRLLAVPEQAFMS